MFTRLAISKPNLSIPLDKVPTKQQLEKLTEPQLKQWIAWLENQPYSENLNKILIEIQAIRIDRGDFKPFKIK